MLIKRRISGLVFREAKLLFHALLLDANVHIKFLDAHRWNFSALIEIEPKNKMS